MIRAVEFVDRGRAYRIDLDTGRVTFVDSEPAPQPDPPKPPPAPELTGFAKTVYDSFMDLPLDDRRGIATEMIHCVDVTLAKAGGLQLGPQEIVDELAGVMQLKGLSGRLGGWRLGDAMASQGQKREEILASLAAIRKAMEAVR